MPFQITSSNFDILPKLKNLLLEKLRKIDKFTSDVPEELRDIRLVFNKGPRFGYRAKLELSMPAATLVARAAGFSAEGAIDEAVEEIIRQINKLKGKLTKERDWRVRRKLKNFLFFSGANKDV